MDIIIGIYKITNPKGKIYIGQSINIKSRIYSYQNKNKGCLGAKIYYSINKYGWENHNMEIIQILDNDLDNKLLRKKLDELEIYWINFYNSVEMGLNLTYGGNGGKPSIENINKRIKSNTNLVLQYDLEGNFIKEWSGVKEISNYFGINKESIRTNINGGTKLSMGFKWFYKNKTPKIFKSKLKNTPVNQYDLGGNFIKTWGSIREAEILFGNKEKYLNNNIKACCNGNQKTAYKYKWNYVDIQK